ncbi:3-methylcrotonyl-CoA carboxylase alpha subunit/acetyl-CoA/propionyl-CoA carboxylase, biotin carboxylase, biotin carboxyl carrier protein [Tistlia consotensis]|uniref:3-methylcrotonyl-CoA carboxylase alpha subunit/acetyl-CoA/propionyl-CoA carboxylase, biotin carboxylase, biotin carboxyl carrier protein n=1 Tax=Tistlia consotensis USBA 355 TaxID=560819 RepID=A0A1Y6CLS2_9PROT|nr:biotin carboxylase N-terminal domain-containing protein [Tistlia consotensis]SMF72340.1 3-methylcrotonyl-CoA carboxylase alpha subunit/acetyl-CoA/propionyl-CoA carboxylase, biotin carboxylase, biotin carboxyl carrier protein [Tistlia consotensis USBA 355]SNS08920.1 3-methylcrotonyl-CoA carboxylase alpha subunit/acetyl-CoA/propionyl-CoA carboxylase, biotin carboxylase, biotin carboxyl carrier protein [Tistlia consotensis]
MTALPSCLLIANRGEIAVRIARTCRALGIRAVAVHSAADAGAAHVRACDQAVALAGAEPSAGYLDGAQLIAAARAAGAQAIHPGYGFLAENAAFAQACAAAGLTFVGPSPAAIRAMGDKIAAKALAAEAGVPVVPGIAEGGGGLEALAEAARTLAFPLLVKASAGGGGRGMRIVERPEALPEALALARREAEAAFGDGRLLVERYVASPRHVEVQVFGDRQGNALHLFERDCSVQRRHQKLIEEAPAPGLSEATRRGLHEAALQLVRRIGYDNAGTVEFVLDAGSREFFFLEMNTRLQVEHPVTEAILASVPGGLDLVEWQIRVAAGQPLPLAQAAIRPAGWAIEARINAEDAADGFRPQTGRIAGLALPEGPGIRVDAGLAEGQAVTPFYDSLLAKVIAWGPDRATALARLERALGETALLGVTTNAAFLRRVLRDEAFAAGVMTTHLLAERWPEGWRPAPEPLEPAAAALVLRGRPAPADSPWSSLAGWRLGAAAGLAARSPVVLLDPAGERRAFWLALGAGRATLQPLDESAPPLAVTFAVEGERLTVGHEGRTTAWRFRVEGETLHLDGGAGWRPWRAPTGLAAWTKPRAQAADGEGSVRAAGPGLVASVEVAAGDPVEPGTPLVVVESMKLFQTVRAGLTGRVAAVACRAGQAVAAGDLLVEIEAGE